MKLHLPHKLLLALLAIGGAGLAAGEAVADLGNIMYVGDSITHGYGGPSYRWQMHKIFADNGISYNSVGVTSGNYSNGVAAGTAYGNSVYNNVHSSVSGERAWDVSGRKKNTNRLGGTNINDWLGLDETYTGPYKIDPATEMPQTFVVLLGTNDTLSDYASLGGIGSGTNLQQVLLNMFGYDSATGTWDMTTGDMTSIIGSMREANANADIIVQTIPTYSPNHKNNSLAQDFAAIEECNRVLKEWAGKMRVQVVQSDAGMVDVANTAKPYSGVPSMLNDGLHPSLQGDMIMAGNLAKAMGYAGRSAGQARKGGAGFNVQTADVFANAARKANVTLSGSELLFADGATLAYEWGTESAPEAGFTVEFRLSDGLGNGYADSNWNTSGNFSLAVGDGNHSGLLHVNEAYIRWGDTTLYSTDASALTQTLRVAYVYGNSEQGLSSGYYVWLDDMLIGEALGSVGAAAYGVTLTNGTGGSLGVADLVLDSTGSWAPLSNGLVNEQLIISPLAAETNPGEIRWYEGVLYNTNSGTIGNNLRAGTWDSSAGATGRIVGATYTGGNASEGLQVSTGNYTGNIQVDIAGPATAAKWSTLQYANGKLTGNASLRFRDFTGTAAWTTIFGAANCTGIDGNVYMEFSAEGLKINAGTFNGLSPAVAGTFNASVTGEIRMVFNAGTFNGDIIGAEAHEREHSVGSTNIFVNGGVINGSIYAAGSTSSVTGGTAITITGNAAEISGSINAGGNIATNGYTGGTIGGNATITINDVTAGDAAKGFDKYSGSISGGDHVAGLRILNINNTRLESFNATLSNFDKIEINRDSDIGLTSLGGASELILIGNLTLKEGTYENLNLNNSGTLTLKGQAKMAMTSSRDENQAGTIVVDGAGASFNGGGVTSSNAVEMREGHAEGLENFKGAFMAIKATGDVTLGGVTSEQLTSLDVLGAGASVSGLSGDISLGESVITLDTEALVGDKRAIALEDGKTLTITDSLTLNLSEELLAVLQERSGINLTANANSDEPAKIKLYLTNGNLNVDAANVSIGNASVYGMEVLGSEGAIAFRLAPEPTTCTLSLLALAALAARRRRK